MLGRKMTHYKAKVAIKRDFRGRFLAYAIYDSKTGGVILADNCSVGNFYCKRFWEAVYSDLKVARRMSRAGYKLEPLWGHTSDHGSWEYLGEVDEAW